MLQGVIRDLEKLSAAVERLSTQQTQSQQLAMITISCSNCGSPMYLTTNYPSRFQEGSTLFQQRAGQSQSLIPYSYSNSKCGGNNSQCNSGLQGASSSLQVHSPSSQDDSATMITPYEQDSSPKKNDVQLLLEGMVDLQGSMKNQMATIPPLDNLHAFIGHSPILNSSSLISNCEAEKGSCSDVSSVQTGPGSGLEAWSKVEEQIDHTPTILLSDELTEPSAEMENSNPSPSSHFINPSHAFEHLVGFASTCDAGKSVSCEHVGPVAELYQHELDPIPWKVDVQLKKPPDNWANKKFIKVGDKVMKIVERSGAKDGSRKIMCARPFTVAKVHHCGAVEFLYLNALIFCHDFTVLIGLVIC
ncbi:Transposon Ty3-G Gag-Pol polyprotein [Senna tora]|uniref:Transposon Ty3-G Gag-Pol polyprotein n=1 Tax=Senna tora TaxID=362788 RepID=A0A834SZ32_9FABA|nr:Transposon Ty3-G Gag-Pol polyprotein [Senna tora]